MIIFITLLILSVILINGWTDAPNAIAGCVSTRSLSPRAAVCLAAACNFSGAVVMSLISPKVAVTLYNIVDLGDGGENALCAVCAGLLAVIVWAVAAWRFGLPTSESHALISGLTGAAVAARSSFSAVNTKEWALVITGLFATTLPPFILGYIFNCLLRLYLKSKPRRSVMRYFTRAQSVSAAASAILHGAQDSQKFIGVYMLSLSLFGVSKFSEGKIPLHLAVLCAAVMTLGTMLGGMRIIKKVGCEMADLDAAGGSAADAASSAVLLICSLLGIPASTTHSKACAMMGTGFCKKRGVNPRIAAQLFVAWGLTFPICGLLGFLFFRLIFGIFY